MDSRKESERDSNKTNKAKSYKGQEDEESHDHSDPEGIWHIEDVCTCDF